MSEIDKTTLERIQDAARKEFSEKGFLNASLRIISKEAGVTNGALYGYFSSKETLFASIVEPHAMAIMNAFMRAQTGFSELPKEQQPEHMGVESGQCIDFMLNYIYDHYADCKLLICSSDGTAYAGFIDRMVDVEVEATFRYIDVLKSLGKDVSLPDEELAHMIASGMMNGIFEVVRHDMPKERAKAFVGQLRAFYIAGWTAVFEG